jgi:rare lipoprotein A
MPRILTLIARVRARTFMAGSLWQDARLLLWCLVVLLAAGPGCSTAASTSQAKYSHPTQRPYKINNKTYYPIPSSYGFQQKGIASWYGSDFHGRKTSNGETYNMYNLTAAHKTLPMNTVLLVKNLDNNREIVVRVNDRGPFVRGRVVDLSYGAARKIDMVGSGTARVIITALGEAGKRQEEIIEMARGFYEGYYYVQIGAFTNPDNAIRLQNRFLEAGHKTIIKKYRGKKTLYYRVQVFVGNSLKDAAQARVILEKRGYRGAFVVAQ